MARARPRPLSKFSSPHFSALALLICLGPLSLFDRPLVGVRPSTTPCSVPAARTPPSSSSKYAIGELLCASTQTNAELVPTIGTESSSFGSPRSDFRLHRHPTNCCPMHVGEPSTMPPAVSTMSRTYTVAADPRPVPHPNQRRTIRNAGTISSDPYFTR